MITHKYPIFVPTKSRHKTAFTINALKKIGADFSIVVEEYQYMDYAPLMPKDKIIVVPHKDKGLTATRNWIWDYAKNELKTPYFWTFDDNIRSFYRLNKNIKYRLETPSFLAAIEDWMERYENVYISGMQYEMFVPRKKKTPPIIFNTRIYSNMLIKTDIPFRNVTFYNDDTDLCLRILKKGNCTALFCSFLADKIATMTVKGGMTDYYEKTNKRKEFAEELKKAHPDVVKIVWKFNRWHHKVNYKPFKNNKLIRKKDFKWEDLQDVNNYNMIEVKTN